MKLTKTESAIIMALKGMLEPFAGKSGVLYYIRQIVCCIENNDRHGMKLSIGYMFNIDDERKKPGNWFPFVLFRKVQLNYDLMQELVAIFKTFGWEIKDWSKTDNTIFFICPG
jgi:hypothetical protein